MGIRALLGVALAGALATAAASAGAQTVRGTVVLADSVTPARGVIVLATDERGTTVNRTLTNDRGIFTLDMHAAGQYGLQVLRIGFRPTLVPAIAVEAGGTTTLRLVASGAAISLARVTVREKESCRIAADTGLIVARVWEEARKAMLTTQLRGDAAPLSAEWIKYDRTMDSAARVVRAQHVATTRSATTHAFVSIPVDSLAANGYARIGDDATEYYAPDAAVLLSDFFVGGHCFGLETAATADSLGHPAWIGLTFRPARQRSSAREIAGTLWIDRASAELRTLEFTYTNLPDAILDARAGGNVEFLRLADGNWLVSRWHLRMPQIVAAQTSLEGGFRRVTKPARSAVVGAIQLVGGELVRVMRGDSVVYKATGASIAVQVTSRDKRQTVGGAVLSLDGTDYFATADSAGRVRLSPVLAGRYQASVRTSQLDSIGMPATTREISTHEARDIRVDSIALPTPDEVLASVCRDSVKAGEAMLHGRVTDLRERPVNHATVLVNWFAPGKVNDGKFFVTQRSFQTFSDAQGRWRVCGVPRELNVTVRATSDTLFDRQDATIAMGSSFQSVDLHVGRTTIAATSARTAAGLAADGATAMLQMTVVDARGAPLSDAAVEIVSASATPPVVTDQSGRALMNALEPGRITLHVRRIGFTPGDVVVSAKAGWNTARIALGQSAPLLDTVRVAGAQTPQRLDEFEARRARHEATASFNRDDILKVNPADTWQMLSRVSAMKLMASGKTGAMLPVSNRGMRVTAAGAKPCFMLVMIDGVMMNGDKDGVFDLRGLPSPDQIHGIEVFAGGASVPVKYGGASGGAQSEGAGKDCGLIAIWTR